MDDKKFQKIVKIGLLVVLAIALCFTVIFYFQYRAALRDPKNRVVYHNTDEELGINPTVAENLENYRCVALYGIDEDGISGIMLVVAINWDTHHSKIFKVDANTFMELSNKDPLVIKGRERFKFACSYAYSRMGLVSSMKMLNRHLDLNIREGIAVNLEAVQILVDELGGIKIAMSQSMCNEINRRFYHPGQIRIKNGKAKLNGQQTLEYISTCNNTHETSEVDAASSFGVFAAMVERAKEEKEESLLKILTTVYKGCDANMNIKDLAVFIKEIDTYDVEATSSWPYTYKKKLISGYNMEIPQTLSSNVCELHRKLFDQENYKPTKTCQRLSSQNK